jgi:hypothetical protein
MPERTRRRGRKERQRRRMWRLSFGGEVVVVVAAGESLGVGRMTIRLERKGEVASGRTRRRVLKTSEPAELQEPRTGDVPGHRMMGYAVGRSSMGRRTRRSLT